MSRETRGGRLTGAPSQTQIPPRLDLTETDRRKGGHAELERLNQLQRGHRGRSSAQPDREALQLREALPCQDAVQSSLEASLQSMEVFQSGDMKVEGEACERGRGDTFIQQESEVVPSPRVDIPDVQGLKTRVP